MVFSRRVPLLFFIPAAAFILAGCLSSGGLAESEVKTQKRADAKDDAQKKDSDDGFFILSALAHDETRIRVKGEPSVAEVFIDGISMGFAPRDEETGEGYHDIRVVLDGYREWNERVYCEEGEETVVEYELEPRLGYVRASVVPEDALIEAEGWKPLQPGLNPVLVGRRLVTASRFGYASVAEVLEVVEGEEISFHAELAPKDMELEASLSRIAFNPKEPGKLGGTVLSATPDGYGYVRISVVDGNGTALAEKIFPFASSDEELSLEWRGRDGRGRIVPVGAYQARFESWAVREPLDGGAFPDQPPDATKSYAIRITDEVRLFTNAMSGLSGLAYSPDAEVHAGALQANVAGAGTYVSPETWFGYLSAEIRIPSSMKDIPWELGVSAGLETFPSDPLSFRLGLGWKMALVDTGRDFLRFKGALGIKAKLYPTGVVVDPFADMIGASLALPFQAGLGPLDFILCPEILLTPYAVGDPASVVEYPLSRPWNWIPYARGGLRWNLGPAQVGLSGFCRFLPLNGGVLAADPPFGIAAEAVMSDRGGTRYAATVMAQIEDAERWYLMMGLSVGLLSPMGD